MNSSVTRLSTNVSRIFGGVRRFSIERVESKDMKIVKNPSNEQIEQFQKLIGGDNDIKLLKNTMKDNYHLYLLCHKDSTVLSGTQSILYKSLNPSTPDFQTFGLSYQPDNIYHLLPHLMCEMAADLDSVNMNSGGCVDSKNSAVWRKVLHTKVRGPTYYESSYKASEVFNPELEFDDVAVVKKFQEVPSEDVIKYDNSIFPYDRKEFLLAKFNEGFGRAAYDKSGKVIGIGLVSFEESSGNCEIGPMYCDNKNAAQAIFQSVLEEMKTFNEIRVRCSDKFEESATWIRPFLRCRHKMTPFGYIKFNRVIPDGLNFSKVFVNSNPSSAPC